MTLTSAIRLHAARGIAVAATILITTPYATAQDQPQAAAESPTVVSEGEQATDLDEVVATVNGTAITVGDLAIAAQDIAQRLGRQGLNVPISEILNIVIELQIIAKAAEAAGVEDRDQVQRQLAFQRLLTMRNAYLSERAAEVVTDEAVRARYDEEVAAFEPQDERRLRHILVETEEEGKQIIADIEAGGDFAAIATEKSKDPGSAPNGGDLDFVAKGATVPEFEEAAFALGVGEHTKAPVQSPFGWHVIKVEETRKSSPPEFAAEEARIRTEMQRDFVTSEIDRLRADADIQIAAPEASSDGAEAGGADSQSETPVQ